VAAGLLRQVLSTFLGIPHIVINMPARNEGTKYKHKIIV
jgi:hypothetical protein